VDSDRKFIVQKVAYSHDEFPDDPESKQ
jgi:hypothetical protein